MRPYAKLWILALMLCITPFLILLSIKISPTRKDREIRPVKYSKKVLLKTYDEKSLYYHLDSLSPLSVIVDGPTLLRIITRLDFSELSNKLVPYTIYITTDNDSPKVYHKESKVSVLSEYVLSDEQIFPGKIRNIFINVPKGRHTYTLSLDKDAKYTLKVKFIIKSTKDTSNKHWTKIIPNKFEQNISLKIGERVRGYYLSKKDNPLTFVTEGLTRAKILSRLIFTKENLFPRQYTVEVFEDGILKDRYLFKSKPSATTKCKEREELIPGIKKTFFIEIPDGQHTYFLIPSLGDDVLFSVSIEKAGGQNAPEEKVVE